ncbi:MAG TPA: hypothetical protein VFA27_07965 [Vicinamibacterales bacterium]|nr:hypothetical protein [Vicinamibacterales bacterium]
MDSTREPLPVVPPLPEHAPTFLCPVCQCTLHYEGTRDASDRYTCPEGCGAYERDRSTHRLRAIAP